MTCETIPDVAIDTPYEFEITIRRKNSATGDDEAATGLTVTARFSATAGGADLGTTSTSLAERGSLGIYYGVISAANLTTYLAAYKGLGVYEVYLVSGAPVESRKVRIVATTT